MGALAEGLLLARRHRTVLRIYQLKETWRMRALFCVLPVLWVLLYPLLVFVYILKARRTGELRFLDRLRFHWNRPLTTPQLEGAGYNFLDYLCRHAEREASFEDSKLAWRRRFLECGLKTPDLFLVIDETTPPAAARDLPQVDVVVKRNCGGRGREVSLYRFDRRSARFEGTGTAEDIIRRAQSTRKQRLKDNSSLVMRAITVSPRMPHGEFHQHLRCITVKRGGEPVLFRAMMQVQFDRARFVTNHAQGARVFDVTTGSLDGVPLPHFEEAAVGCVAVHRGLDFLSAGWDILIAEDGPYFLEGNIHHSVHYPEYPDFYAILRDYYVATGLLAAPVLAELSRALTEHSGLAL